MIATLANFIPGLKSMPADGATADPGAVIAATQFEAVFAALAPKFAAAPAPPAVTLVAGDAEKVAAAAGTITSDCVTTADAALEAGIGEGVADIVPVVFSGASLPSSTVPVPYGDISVATGEEPHLTAEEPGLKRELRAASSPLPLLTPVRQAAFPTTTATDEAPDTPDQAGDEEEKTVNTLPVDRVSVPAATPFPFFTPAKVPTLDTPPLTAATLAVEPAAVSLPPTSSIDIDALFPPSGDLALKISFKTDPAKAPVALPADAIALPDVPVSFAPVATPSPAEGQAVLVDVPGEAPSRSAPSNLALPLAFSVPAAPALAIWDPGVALFSEPVNHSETTIQHHLQVAHDGEWLDRLARDIAGAASQDARMRFQLNPEHLGSLHVELVNGAEGTSIRLTTETEAARGLIADAQPRLMAEARAQGMRIAEAQIDLGGQGGGQRQTGQDQSAREQVVVVRTLQNKAAEVLVEETPAARERYA